MKVKIKEINNTKMIVVDNEVFDWDLDPNEWKQAIFKCKNDPQMKLFFIGSAQKFFVQCFSEFIGKEITLSEINKALETGEL